MSERFLNNEIHAVGVLRSALAETIGDDADLLADVIEGQTNLKEAIASVLYGIGEDEVLLAGLDKIGKEMDSRAKRIEERKDRRRDAIERAMSVAGIIKLELPQATLSVRRVAPSLEVSDETQIPRDYFVSQPDRLDRRLLAHDLAAGKTVEGAHLSNGSQTLSIRRS